MHIQSAFNKQSFLFFVAVIFTAILPPLCSGQIAFTEEAISRGIDFDVVDSDAFGYGVALVDLDNDNDPDIVATGQAGGIPGFFENNGNGFFTRAGVTGLPQMQNASGIAAADYDGDGDMDLYISMWSEPNILLRNDGGFTFQDVAPQAGVDDAGRGTGCVWGDFNGDSWLDLYVSNHTEALAFPPGSNPNRLYQNKRDGTFVDMAQAQGVDDDQMTFQAVFFDMDHDTDPDLYLITDRGTPGIYENKLFENVNGTYVDLGGQSGANIHIDGMTGTVGDFNKNGYQDLYVTNIFPGNALLLNQGNKTFVESAAAWGVASYEVGWAAMFFDYDNDTHKDIYVANMLVPNRLYVHGGAPPCVDIASTMNLEGPTGPLLRSFTAAYGDVDGDGDLDIVAPFITDRVRLYINHEGETRRWIKFKIRGRGGNRFSIGAIVRVCVGSSWQMQEVIAGANTYKSHNDITVHFGMDSALIADEVQVVWPGGATRTLYNLDTNETWVILAPPDGAEEAARIGSGQPWLLLSQQISAASHYPLPRRRGGGKSARSLIGE